MKIDNYLEKFLVGSTWISTGIVTLGVLLSHDIVIKVGIAFFILIPFTRVLGLLISFIKTKDRSMAIVAGSVILIILSSFFIGLKH